MIRFISICILSLAGLLACSKTGPEANLSGYGVYVLCDMTPNSLLGTDLESIPGYYPPLQEAEITVREYKTGSGSYNIRINIPYLSAIDGGLKYYQLTFPGHESVHNYHFPLKDLLLDDEGWRRYDSCDVLVDVGYPIYVNIHSGVETFTFIYRKDEK